MGSIQRYSGNSAILLPAESGKDERHRLLRFATWLDETNRGWAAPDLRAYRDHLSRNAGLSPESVSVHLSTIRSRYRTLLLDRKLFFALIPSQASFAEHKALVDELMARIESQIDPRMAPVRTRTSQERPDSENVRLTRDQARELLLSPNAGTLGGIRDQAIIATLLCTGLREAELCELRLEDLRQSIEGEPALHVRAGKGMKERLVPYGSMRWCLNYVTGWLRRAAIGDGYVFRGLRKSDHVRSTPLNERTVQKILGRYPIRVNDRSTIVRPHDCRRTYARWLYDAGVKVDAIRQNMGHETIEMTFHYIGQPGIADRLPPELLRDPAE